MRDAAALGCKIDLRHIFVLDNRCHAIYLGVVTSHPWNEQIDIGDDPHEAEEGDIETRQIKDGVWLLDKEEMESGHRKKDADKAV